MSILVQPALVCALIAATLTVGTPPIAPRPTQSASQAEAAACKRDAKRARKAAREWWRQ